MYDYRNPFQYQNPYPANVNMPTTPIQDNMIVSVQSEQDARNYLVAYGHSIIFKDENKPLVFYTKQLYRNLNRRYLRFMTWLSEHRKRP